MNRFKYKHRIALLLLGFSLFYTQAADKDALGKTPNTRINTARGFTDEDINEKQIKTVNLGHMNQIYRKSSMKKTLIYKRNS